MTLQDTLKGTGIRRAYNFCLGATLASLPAYAQSPAYQEGANGDRIALYTIIGGISLIALAGIRALYKSHKEELREREATPSQNMRYGSRPRKSSSRPSPRRRSRRSDRYNDEPSPILVDNFPNSLENMLENPKKASLHKDTEQHPEEKSYRELEAPERSDPTPHHESSKFESNSGFHHSDYSSDSGFGSSSFDSGSFDGGSCGGGDCGGCGGGD